MGWACLQPHADGVILRVRVTPNAKRTQAGGLREDRLTIRLQAPPVEGRANQALCRWAARAFGLAKGRVRLLRGERGREKDLLLRGIEPVRAEERLTELVGSGAADAPPSPDRKKPE